MHCETGVSVVDGVALVTATLDNPVAVPRRVRLANRLDGPVCPPRRAGVPALGWDRDGVTVRVAAGGWVALGYACPLVDREPADPPAVVADTVRAGGDGRAVGDDDRRRVRTAMHRLGRTGPPRDAVPTERRSPAIRRSVGRTTTDACDGTAPTNPASTTAGEPDEDPLPAATTAWLDRVADRVAAAESLTDPDPGDAADALREAVEVDRASTATDADSPPALAAAERVAAQVAADADALRTLADRADDLARRAAATDPSTAALRRLCEREARR